MTLSVTVSEASVAKSWGRPTSPRASCDGGSALVQHPDTRDFSITPCTHRTFLSTMNDVCLVLVECVTPVGGGSTSGARLRLRPAPVSFYFVHASSWRDLHASLSVLANVFASETSTDDDHPIAMNIQQQKPKASRAVLPMQVVPLSPPGIAAPAPRSWVSVLEF